MIRPSALFMLCLTLLLPMAAVARLDGPLEVTKPSKVRDLAEIRSSRMENGVKIPCEGQLFYRGYSIEDLVRSMPSDHSFGFEVTAYVYVR